MAATSSSANGDALAAFEEALIAMGDVQQPISKTIDAAVASSTSSSKKKSTTTTAAPRPKKQAAPPAEKPDAKMTEVATPLPPTTSVHVYHNAVDALDRENVKPAFRFATFEAALGKIARNQEGDLHSFEIVTDGKMNIFLLRKLKLPNKQTIKRAAKLLGKDELALGKTAQKSEKDFIVMLRSEKNAKAKKTNAVKVKKEKVEESESNKSSSLLGVSSEKAKKVAKPRVKKAKSDGDEVRDRIAANLKKLKAQKGPAAGSVVATKSSLLAD